MNQTPENNSPALCQSCGIRPAAVEFVQVTGSQKREVSLCRECAASHGLEIQLDAFQRLAQLLMHQMRPFSQSSEEWQALQKAVCGRCGLHFDEFVQTGLLGCPQCYTDFHDYLVPVLRRLHGVTRQTVENAHESDVSASPDSHESETHRSRLEAELQIALLDENFEMAARIRDKLRNLSS